MAASLVASLAAFLRVCLPTEAPPPRKARQGALRLVSIPAFGFEETGSSAVPANISAVVRTICGLEAESARSYLARSRALRSVASRRDLSANDVAALLGYVLATNDALSARRTATLKDDVLKLLRHQLPVPALLVSALVEVVGGGKGDPLVIDRCLRHLAILWRGFSSFNERQGARWAFEKAAVRHAVPYAGAALYALADGPRKGAEGERRLRYLTVTLATDPLADRSARLAALALAGERGYAEILPSVRGLLAGERSNATAKFVAIGALGRLGGAADVPLLERLREKGGVRFRPALTTALDRISRHGAFPRLRGKAEV